jgi:hypothetical protein
MEVKAGDPSPLPQNWHVIVNEENMKPLCKWRFGDDYWEIEIGSPIGMSKWIHREHATKGHNEPGGLGGGTEEYDFGVEISFDLFRKYVLFEVIPIDEDLSYLIGLFEKLNIK